MQLQCHCWIAKQRVFLSYYSMLFAKLISFLGRRLFVRISVNQEYLLNVGTDPTPTELS